MWRQNPSAGVAHGIEARDGDPIVTDPKLSTGRRGVAAVAFIHADSLPGGADNALA